MLAFSDEQIQQYLNDRNVAVWEVLQQTPTLLELLRTPYLLEIFALGFQTPEAQSELIPLRNVLRGALLDLILERFIQFQYATYEHTHHQPPPFTLEQVRKVLGWAATWNRVFDQPQQENQLTEADFRRSLKSIQLAPVNVTAFLAFVQDLGFLTMAEASYRFLHRSLYQHFAYTYLHVLLRYKEAHVRWRSAEAWGDIGYNRDLQALMAALNDPDPYGYVLREVVFALGKIGDVRAVEPLLNHLPTARSDSVLHIAQGLAQIGESRISISFLRNLEKASLEPLLSMSSMESVPDSHAISALLSLLCDADAAIQHNALEMLCQLSDIAVEPLIAMFSSSDERLRQNPAYILGENSVPQAVSALTLMLQDAYEDVRHHAAEALTRIAGWSGMTILVTTIKNQRDYMLDNGILSLAQLNTKTHHDWVVLLLTDAMENTDKHYIEGFLRRLNYVGTPIALEVVQRWREKHPSS